MEIAVIINRLDDFEVSLQNPSLLSRVILLSKWGALILALVASLGTIVNRFKVLIVKLRRQKSIAKEPLLKFANDDDFDSEDETCSSSSSSFGDDQEEEDDDDDDDDEKPESDRWRSTDEDFRVAGGSGRYVEGEGHNRKNKFRRRFSWADFAGGRSVVKLWDHLSLGLDFDVDDDSSESLISVYDTNREKGICSHIGGKRLFPTVSTSPSPPMILTAARASCSGGVSLRVWDTRVRCRIPAILAEWTRRPQLGKTVGHVGFGGVEKLYVRDDTNGDLTIGDVRNISSPLASLAGSDVDAW
jgi:hypothetical protein